MVPPNFDGILLMEQIRLTSWSGKYHMYIPGGAGFLPSTVSVSTGIMAKILPWQQPGWKRDVPKRDVSELIRTPSKDQGNTVLKYNTNTSQINTFERNLPSPQHHYQYPFLISGFKTPTLVSSQLLVGFCSRPKIQKYSLLSHYFSKIGKNANCHMLPPYLHSHPHWSPTKWALKTKLQVGAHNSTYGVPFVRSFSGGLKTLLTTGRGPTLCHFYFMCFGRLNALKTPQVPCGPDHVGFRGQTQWEGRELERDRPCDLGVFKV